MMKSLIVCLSVLVSLSAFADISNCLQPLKNTQGLNPLSLQDSYLLRIHKTLAGELDPFVLGDGGIVTATWIAGVHPTKDEAKIFMVMFEPNGDHPNTTQIDKAYYKGWPFLLIKANCLAPMENERQVKALNALVTRHMNPPRGSQFKYYLFK